MGKHTSGPWYAWLARGADSGCRTIRTEHGRTPGGYRGTELATTNGLHDDEEDAANACLIAAAPDLFEALEELAEIVQGALDDKNINGLCMDSFTLQPARAAIAKAKGEIDVR